MTELVRKMVVMSRESQGLRGAEDGEKPQETTETQGESEPPRGGGDKTQHRRG